MKALLTAAVLFTGCASTWDQYPGSLYSALRGDNPRAIVEHQRLLQRLVDSSEAAGRLPPAGICAELAWYSWRIGKKDLANEALVKERSHYPQSEKFVAILAKFLPSLPVIEAVPDDAKSGGNSDF